MSLFALLFALAGILLSISYIVLKAFLIVYIVTATFKLLKKLMAPKAMIIAHDEMNALQDAMREKGLTASADKLSSMMAAKEKLALSEQGNGYYAEGLRAEDTTQDDMKYGGVVFESGEYIQYDENGGEHRNVLKQ